MFRRVQVRVRSTIGQEPWLGFSALPEVNLAGLNIEPPKSVATPRMQQEASEAAREWVRVDKASVAELETFVRRHGSSPEADYAGARLGELKRQADATQQAAKKKSEDEARAKAEADRQRLAMLQQQEDEVAKKRAETEAAKKRVNDTATLSRSLQAELKRVGCDPGAVDGEWGVKAKEALREFSQTAKVTLSVEEPTEDALKAVAAQQARICALKCGANEREKGGRCVANAKPDQVTAKRANEAQATPQKNCAFGFTHSIGANHVGQVGK
jgi:peptidoglycan hydrolase-like protein with peptidoglycan-binding domain